MNKKLVYTGLVFFALGIIATTAYTQFTKEEIDEDIAPIEIDMTEVGVDANYKTGIYSWSPQVYKTGSLYEFYGVLEYLGIDKIYQYVENADMSSLEFSEYLKLFNQKGKEVYYLTGSAEWGVEEDAVSLINEINIVANYNDLNEHKFTGILFDVEPYILDGWLDNQYEIMQSYTENMEIAYEYAKEHNLKIILAIPFWLEDISEKHLETLIADCSDEVSVMNYNRANEFEQMQTEIELAKKHNKPIECIFEYQQVGQYGLEDINTYANLGIKESLVSFADIYNTANYADLGLCYHYYNSIYDLI